MPVFYRGGDCLWSQGLCVRCLLSQHALLIQVLQSVTRVIFGFKCCIAVTIVDRPEISFIKVGIRIQRFDSSEFGDFLFDQSIEMAGWQFHFGFDTVPKTEVHIHGLSGHGKQWVWLVLDAMPDRTDPDRAYADFPMEKIQKLGRSIDGYIDVLDH